MDPPAANRPKKKSQKKAANPGSGNQREAEASGSTSQEQRKFAILVDLAIPSTGELVVENMDAWALRRFTMVGKEQLPRLTLHKDPSYSPTIELHEEGSRAPSKGATFAVLKWMQERQHVDTPGCIQGDDLGGDRVDDVEFLVNAYAACSALRTTFGLWDLTIYIKRKIEENGVTKQQLAAMWEVLPHNHLITKLAVKWLVNMQASGEMTPGFDDACSEYISTQPELRMLFDQELERAKELYLPRSA